MAFSAHKNFALATVSTPPSPGGSGTSLTVNSGQGALFPAVPFNATVWPTGVTPISTNAEIVRVTNIVADTLTITRQQEGSSGRVIIATDQIAASVTARTLTDVEYGAHEIVNVKDAQFGAVGDGVTDDTAAFQAAADFLRPEAGAGLAGGEVFVPRGTYRIAGTVSVLPGVVFRGEGGRQYNYQGGGVGEYLTTIVHDAPAGNTDCFVFPLSAWDTYGRSSGAGLRNMLIVGNANSRRMISWPSGIIKPVLDGVQTFGGSVGLYFVYAIEATFHDCTFGMARDYGIYIGYATDVSTTVTFYGCRCDGNGTTATGLYVDGAITTNFIGCTFDECTSYLARIGVTANAEVGFTGCHFESNTTTTYTIRAGEYSGGTKSKLYLTDTVINFIYANVTNPVGCALDYVSSFVVSGQSVCGPGAAFSATTHTDIIVLAPGTVWGGNFGAPYAACTDATKLLKVIGPTFSGASNFGLLNHRALYFAPQQQSPTPGASFIPRPIDGGKFCLSSGSNFTINGPDSDTGTVTYTPGTVLEFEIYNSGAAPIAITWWTPYKTEFGAGTQSIAAGKYQTISFQWNGTYWIQLGKCSGDVG